MSTYVHDPQYLNHIHPRRRLCLSLSGRFFTTEKQFLLLSGDTLKLINQDVQL